MFVVKSNYEIGLHLKSLILHKYKSVRQFCISYLDVSDRDSEDPDEIRKLTNRFSQILNGNKAIQTYDLPIISELLSVSCEDILSCGETKVPLCDRRTNYNIAFSNNEADWADYLAREDCIAAYADEFGKTVLDYAIEFKNYGFIKYLINKGYITLVADDPRLMAYPNFGAESKIVERPYEHQTLQDSLYENKLLRSQIMSLAIANNDVKMLETFRAREFPPQLDVNILYNDFSFAEYYDRSFIKEIANSQIQVFDYFLKEYATKTYGGKFDVIWIFPFVGELVDACLRNKNGNRAMKALVAIAEHNKVAYDKFHKTYLLAAKKMKELYRSRPFKDALDGVKREYRMSKDKDFVSFHPYYMSDIEPVAFNIIRVDLSSRDESIQSRIDEINNLYDKIVIKDN